MFSLAHDRSLRLGRGLATSTVLAQNLMLHGFLRGSARAAGAAQDRQSQ
jgi:hypothetical protein